MSEDSPSIDNPRPRAPSPPFLVPAGVIWLKTSRPYQESTLEFFPNGPDNVLLAPRAESGNHMKVRQVIRRLIDDGWVKVSQKGSHPQFEHPTKPGKVTVPGKPGDDLPQGTYRSILRQAGLEE